MTAPVWCRATVAIAFAAIAWVGCVASEEPIASDASEDPNAGLLRDFMPDSKVDSAGHPLNARVTDAQTLCPGAGVSHFGALRLSQQACVGEIDGSEQTGDLVASARIWVRAHTGSGVVVSAAILGVGGTVLASTQLTAAQLRQTTWFDLPLAWRSAGTPVTLRLTPGPGAVIDLDYIEVFPQRFGLVAAPGSGVYADSDKLVFEVPRSRRIDQLWLDRVDITSRLSSLLASGRATQTTTAYRTLIEVAVGDLASDRKALSELELRAGGIGSRMQLRRAPIACNYEGAANGVKVLVTGFQPFPAIASHENVSAVAVSALEPSRLRNARVLRVVMPVEYDRAAAMISELIARCAPRVVISFGQGGNTIAIEQVAYNLQDTSEVPGGAPDNRGVIRAATPIDPSAPATRIAQLPLQAIAGGLIAIGEQPQYSQDPGRYICNNVMFANIGAMAGRGVGGFIHLPYTTHFDAQTRARFGKVVQAAVQATVDAL